MKPLIAFIFCLAAIAPGRTEAQTPDLGVCEVAWGRCIVDNECFTINPPPNEFPIIDKDCMADCDTSYMNCKVSYALPAPAFPRSSSRITSSAPELVFNDGNYFPRFDTGNPNDFLLFDLRTFDNVLRVGRWRPIEFLSGIGSVTSVEFFVVPLLAFLADGSAAPWMALGAGSFNATSSRWELQWTPDPNDRREGHALLFVAQVHDPTVGSAGGPAGQVLAIAVGVGSDAMEATVAVDLDPNVINLASHAPWVTAYIEPDGFDPASIDVATMRLGGTVPAETKIAAVGDRDMDELPDLTVKFSRAALDPLLMPGVNTLELTGSLVTGESFSGTDEVTVIDPPDVLPTASISPNPLNPAGVLTVRTARQGPVTVRMFDLRGRLVRTLLDTQVLPAGAHGVRVDGRGRGGEALASGVYFYRVETGGGVIIGRVAVVK